MTPTLDQVEAVIESLRKEVVVSVPDGGPGTRPPRVEVHQLGALLLLKWAMEQVERMRKDASGDTYGKQLERVQALAQSSLNTREDRIALLVILSKMDALEDQIDSITERRPVP